MVAMEDAEGTWGYSFFMRRGAQKNLLLTQRAPRAAGSGEGHFPVRFIREVLRNLLTPIFLFRIYGQDERVAFCSDIWYILGDI